MKILAKVVSVWRPFLCGWEPAQGHEQQVQQTFGATLATCFSGPELAQLQNRKTLPLYDFFFLFTSSMIIYKTRRENKSYDDMIQSYCCGGADEAHYNMHPKPYARLGLSEP